MFYTKKNLIWYPLGIVLLLAVWFLLSDTGARATSAEPAQTLVIDAGHGGEDGGAVAPDGTPESGINLDIALRLKALADFWGVPAVMTREENTIDYPAGVTTLSQMKKADQDARLALIAQTPGAVLISIHQNYYPSEKPSGIQVFFGGKPGSEALAVTMQGNLTTLLCPENRRVAAGIDSSIYLMRRAECPAVLVECGFLSNPSELAELKDPVYREKLAVVMLASYLQYTKGMIT